MEDHAALTSLLETAGRAAAAAAEIARREFEHRPRIEHKGAIDLVTEIDRRAEQAILEILRDRFPGHAVVAEESSPLPAEGTITWYVDPIDGTTNYAHGLPVFAVSVAAYERGRPLCGVVIDPLRGERFEAAAGRGAVLNGAPIRVSSQDQLGDALLATGFPYDVRTDPRNNLDHFAAFVPRAQAIRRCGSAALDLAYVACGRFDGYWEAKLRPWDMAAGALLVTEAGGRCGDFAGRPLDLWAMEMLATNGRLHASMMDVLLQGTTWMTARPAGGPP